MTVIESRADWGARPARGASYLAGARGVKAHYTGGRVDPATLLDHEACRAAVRGIQRGHMDGNGWADIGYTAVACHHNHVMLGRGPHVLPAANGPGMNAGHYAILLLVGTSGVTQITDGMKLAFHGGRRYLQRAGAAGAEIRGHRDGYSTSCPGPSIYRWVQAGAPRPGGSVPVPDPLQATQRPGDDMEYAAYAHTGKGDLEVPRGEWWSIPWDVEHADPTGVHSGAGTSVLKGDPCVYAGVEFGVTLNGVPAGTHVWTRLAEYRYDASKTPPVDVLQEVGLEGMTVLGDGLTAHHCGSGKLQEGRKLRCQILVAPGPETVTLAGAEVHAPFTR